MTKTVMIRVPRPLWKRIVRSAKSMPVPVSATKMAVALLSGSVEAMEEAGKGGPGPALGVRNSTKTQ